MASANRCIRMIQFLFLLFLTAVIFFGCTYTVPVTVKVEPTPVPFVEPEIPKTVLLAADTICDGIVVNGVDVSGMTYEQAVSAVRNSIARPKGPIPIVIGDRTAELSTDLVAVQDNAQEVLAQAIELGNLGLKRKIESDRERIKREGMNLSIEVQYDIEPLRDEIVRIAQELSYPAKNASIQYHPDLPDKFTFIAAKQGLRVDAQTLFTLIQESLQAGSFKTSVFAQGEVVDPTVTDDQARNSTVLIASYTTSFKKSPYNASNRVFNIAKAADTLNGFVLDPGDEFNFNKAVGPRTAETGWKEAGAIVQGKKELEAGGGICQVSSTIYNAVMIAELEVLQRSPHSWPLSYIPIGQDATVSTDGPNFRFRNNKGTPIVLVTTVNMKKKTITVSIYGKAREDGLVIKFTSQQVSTVAQPPDKITLNAKLAPGTVIVEREGRSGSRSQTYKEYYKDGQLLKRELHHKDYYPPIASILTVGPPLPTASPVKTLPPVLPAELSE